MNQSYFIMADLLELLDKSNKALTKYSSSYPFYYFWLGYNGLILECLNQIHHKTSNIEDFLYKRKNSISSSDVLDSWYQGECRAIVDTTNVVNKRRSLRAP